MAVIDAAPRLPTADDLLRLYRDLCVVRRWLLGRPLTPTLSQAEGEDGGPAWGMPKVLSRCWRFAGRILYGRTTSEYWPEPIDRLGPGILAKEESMATEAERLARLEGAYDHLATKADLANLETRLTKWFAGLLLLVVINVLGTVTGILIALLG